MARKAASDARWIETCTDGSSRRRIDAAVASSAAGSTPRMCPAMRSIFARIAAAAFSMAPAPAIIVRLAKPPTLYGVPCESPP